MAKIDARAGLTPKLISLAVTLCFTAGTALANPTGPTVVQGTAAIHQAGNLLQITNSPNAIINWQSFSIGANEITRFIQQSASSAVLNRVTTQNPSTILGALQSNGRVFLINPNGILFGAGAQVDVAGLVASTLNMSDADFLGGRLRFSEGLGKSVVNDGSITTGAGGSVYLIGSGVTNNGIIHSPQGEVVLAAGNSVELVSPGTPNLRVEIVALDNEARNLGQIISDAGRIGIYAGLINNSGTIRADSAVAEGGRIVLKATKSATLESTSVLSAQGRGGGRIEVLGGEEVKVAGLLDASAPNSGDGGFIETSGKSFSIDSSAVITTAAPFGKTGTWFIDPTDFIIGALGTGENITGAALAILLGTTNVVISSDGIFLPNPPILSQTGTNGDIFVNDTVSWSTANSLTLTARRDVNVNNVITNANTGGINLNAGWDGAGTPDSPNLTPGTGKININADVTSQGSLQFNAGDSINIGTATQTSGVAVTGGSGIVITAGNLTVQGGKGGRTLVQGFASSGNGVTITTTGNVTVNGGTAGGFAHIQGSPDLSMSVGGVVQMNSADPTAPALIESVSPGTIFLTFPNLASDGSQGYFVNGVQGATADPSGKSGFFAAGVPAILGVNLIVTPPPGGVTPPPSLPPTETLAPLIPPEVVDPPQPPAEVTSGSSFVSQEDKEEKKLPFCSS